MSITNVPSSSITTTTTTTAQTVAGSKRVADNSETNQSNKRQRTQSISSLGNSGNQYSVISPPSQKTKKSTNRGNLPASKSSKTASSASSAFTRAIPPPVPSSTQNSTLEGRPLEVRPTEARLPLAYQPEVENGYSYCYVELLLGQIEYDNGNYLEALKHFNNIPIGNKYYVKARDQKINAQNAENFRNSVDNGEFFSQPNQ